MNEKLPAALKARCCFGHLGGTLGNRLFDRLLELGWFAADADNPIKSGIAAGRAGVRRPDSCSGSIGKKSEGKLFMKICIACGMPMTKPSDFPQGDESRDYCVYCAREDGSMQSYPEKLEGTVEFLIRTQGLDREAARQVAARTLSRLPAWKNVGAEE